MRRLAKPLLALGLPGLFLVALACDSANPVAPPGTVLTVNANPSKIAISGQASTITIVGFRPDGNPLHPGTQVNLSTNLGDLGSTLVTVGENGVAQTILTGDGRAGTATVSATLTSGGEASATVDVRIGEDDTTRPTLVISANPSIVGVLQESEISLLARSSDGSSLGAGNRIRLAANLGTLTCERAFFCSDTIGSDCRAVCTDANGEARATFVAGSRAGDGEVSAILGTSEQVMVTIRIRDAPASLDFQANPRTVLRGGDRQIELTATVLNAQGDPVAAASVTFESEVGGSFASGSGLNTTNPQGVAMDTLTVPQNELENRNSFQVRAIVRGEGVTLTRELTINIQ